MTNDLDAVIRSCRRFLHGHHRVRPAAALSALAAATDPALYADRYGSGELIEGFEARLADLLGKESAVFMPSGTMCQPIALRIWSDRAATKRVAFHPTCHLELHEQMGYRELHRLEAELVGPPDAMLTLGDLERVTGPLSTLLLELPQREIGGTLPTWDELLAIVEWARNQGVRLHLDGARLWECGPFYGRPYSEIASLFDSVYVSFYKGLGGIAGAVLAGPRDFVDEARIWQRRQGGNLIHLYPYVLAAEQGLDARLPRIPDYCSRARDVGATLSSLPGVRVVPDPPQTNMMHVVADLPIGELERRAVEIARDTGVWTLGSVRRDLPAGVSRFELTIGDAALDLGRPEIDDLLGRLFERAAR